MPTEDVHCKRCGFCCQAHVGMLVSHEDILRWRREGRDDILRLIENAEIVYGRDGLGDGEYLIDCPFLISEGDLAACAIYDARPQVCRDFRPGSERCSQTKHRT